MRIRQNTIINQYSNPIAIQPKTPLWAFNVKPGSQLVTLNGNFTMAPNDNFGVDATAFIQVIVESILNKFPAEKIIIKNDTQLDVNFIDNGISTETPQVFLIETGFQFELSKQEKLRAMQYKGPQRTTTITIATTFTPYRNEDKIVPKGCMWFFKNSGTDLVFLNSGYRLNSYESFGVDTSHILAKVMEKEIFDSRKIEIINDTQIEFRFENSGFTVPWLPKRQLLLVETHFDIKRA